MKILRYDYLDKKNCKNVNGNTKTFMAQCCHLLIYKNELINKMKLYNIFMGTKFMAYLSVETFLKL